MDGSRVGRNWAQVREHDLPLLLVQRVACLRARSTLDQGFLAALIASQTFRDHVEAVRTGSSIPHISATQIGEFEFVLPPLSEQRRIASAFAALADKVTSNESMNKVLLSLLEEMFRFCFVDFGPVHDKVEGRAPRLAEPAAAAFPDRLSESELGPVPTGWEITRVDSLATIVGGSTPRTAEDSYWNGSHFWATPRDLSPLRTPVLLETSRTITDRGLEQISSGLLPPGTVLLSSRAPIGYRAIAEVPVAVNQGFIAMRPAPGVPNLFLLFWALAAHDQILSRANGSTFLEISKGSFRSIPVVRPSDEALAAFQAIARPLYNQIVHNERESRALQELHRTLLPSDHERAGSDCIGRRRQLAMRGRIPRNTRRPRATTHGSTSNTSRTPGRLRSLGFSQGPAKSRISSTLSFIRTPTPTSSRARRRS